MENESRFATFAVMVLILIAMVAAVIWCMKSKKYSKLLQLLMGPVNFSIKKS